MKLGKRTKESLSGPFSLFRPHTHITPGKAIRALRELQVMSQLELAEKAGLTQSTVSSLENDRVTLGLDRAKAIARALKVHPAVLAFPSWDIEKESA